MSYEQPAVDWAKAAADWAAKRKGGAGGGVMMGMQQSQQQGMAPPPPQGWGYYMYPGQRGMAPYATQAGATPYMSYHGSEMRPAFFQQPAAAQLPPHMYAQTMLANQMPLPPTLQAPQSAAVTATPTVGGAGDVRGATEGAMGGTTPAGGQMNSEGFILSESDALSGVPVSNESKQRITGALVRSTEKLLREAAQSASDDCGREGSSGLGSLPLQPHLVRGPSVVSSFVAAAPALARPQIGYPTPSASLLGTPGSTPSNFHLQLSSNTIKSISGAPTIVAAPVAAVPVILGEGAGGDEETPDFRTDTDNGGMPFLNPDEPTRGLFRAPPDVVTVSTSVTDVTEEEEEREEGAAGDEDDNDSRRSKKKMEVVRVAICNKDGTELTETYLNGRSHLIFGSSPKQAHILDSHSSIYSQHVAIAVCKKSLSKAVQTLALYLLPCGGSSKLHDWADAPFNRKEGEEAEEGNVEGEANTDGQNPKDGPKGGDDSTGTNNPSGEAKSEAPTAVADFPSSLTEEKVKNVEILNDGDRRREVLPQSKLYIQMGSSNRFYLIDCSRWNPLPLAPPSPPPSDSENMTIPAASGGAMYDTEPNGPQYAHRPLRSNSRDSSRYSRHHDQDPGDRRHKMRSSSMERMSRRSPSPLPGVRPSDQQRFPEMSGSASWRSRSHRERLERGELRGDSGSRGRREWPCDPKTDRHMNGDVSMRSSKHRKRHRDESEESGDGRSEEVSDADKRGRRSSHRRRRESGEGQMSSGEEAGSHRKRTRDDDEDEGRRDRSRRHRRNHDRSESGERRHHHHHHHHRHHRHNRY